jgi:Na+/H+ antiporter NhaD/arsenite permease-like protein
VDPVVLAVFVLVYVGMLLGELPWLALDRTGIALLGAIALVATERLTIEAAWLAVDVDTIALLLGLMVVSAQFRLGGFYTALTRRLGAGDHSPNGLLALVVLAAGLLSAILANDIVCLAMAPALVEIAARKGFNPVPYLLALACASNVGSAATLIGNPQNSSLASRSTCRLPPTSFKAACRRSSGLAWSGLVCGWVTGSRGPGARRCRTSTNHPWTGGKH